MVRSCPLRLRGGEGLGIPPPHHKVFFNLPIEPGSGRGSPGLYRLPTCSTIRGGKDGGPPTPGT